VPAAPPCRVYWALGGELRTDREHAHASFLAAAREEGTPWQAPAFEWLGHWYRDVGGDGPRARKCYSRALALDPSLVGRGGGGGLRAGRR
jgi:superkiller protein 3